MIQRRNRLLQVFAIILLAANVIVSLWMADPLPALRGDLRYLTPVYLGAGDRGIDARRFIEWGAR